MTATRKKFLLGLPGWAVLVVILLSTAGVFQGKASGENWSTGFDNGKLSSRQWKTTASGDFRDKRVDVVDLKTDGKPDFRLRLMADTIGTNDKTVKFLGARSTQAFDFSGGGEISLELDWNEQANGSYLTAGLYFCLTETSGNPMDEEEWIRVEYVGVPPGRNARLTISKKSNRRVNWLYTEGWPEQNKEGRRIGKQELKLKFERDRLRVIENGKEIFRSEAGVPGFNRGFIYLQMSSHSNYPLREVFFDNVAVDLN